MTVAHSSVPFKAVWERVFILFGMNSFLVIMVGFFYFAHTFYFLGLTIARENVCADSTNEIVSSPFPVFMWVARVAMYN
jgi:hypothetical protein